jgi:hypothetical protein
MTPAGLTRRAPCPGHGPSTTHTLRFAEHYRNRALGPIAPQAHRSSRVISTEPEANSTPKPGERKDWLYKLRYKTLATTARHASARTHSAGCARARSRVDMHRCVAAEFKSSLT